MDRKIQVTTDALSPSVGENRESYLHDIAWEELKREVGVSISAFLDKAKERQEKSFQQVPQLPGEIFSQGDYEKSSLFLRDNIKAEGRSLDDDFGDVFKFTRAVRSLYNGFKKPLKEREVIVKASMAGFIVKRNRRREEAVIKIANELDASAERRKNDRVAELVNTGNTDDAIALMRIEPETSDLVSRTPAFGRLKVEGSHTITVKTFELLDETKLKSEYVIPEQIIPETPDMSMISRAVRKHGKEAERVVGEGSIRYKEEIRIASTAK